MLDYKWVTVVLVVVLVILATRETCQQSKIEDLEATVDHLMRHESIVVINENLKSKQDRTRLKIEDLIASYRYPSLPSYELDNLARIIVKYSDRYSVPVNLVLAIMTAESAFNRQAVSPVGALGPMQVMPGTAVGIAHDLRVASFDPFAWDDGIRFGTYYLRKMLKTFKGDIELAVRAYNGGPTNVSKGIYHSETVGYHKSVMSVYQWLESK